MKNVPSTRPAVKRYSFPAAVSAPNVQLKPTMISSKPGPVVRPLRARDETARDEGELDRHRQEQHRKLVVGVVARRDDEDRGAGARERERPDPQDGARRHSRSAASLPPESSPFGMKPREPQPPTRSPNSETSRLEVRTICGLQPFAQSRLEISKPSMSGSWTSSRTTSGTEPGDSLERGGAVLGLADHLVPLGLEELPRGGAEGRVVVDDQDTGHG